MPSQQELDFQISPLVQESLVHNTRTLHNLQSLTASLFGIGAGILGLESYSGFLFYLVFSLVTTLLFYGLRIAPAGVSSSSSPSSSSSSTSNKGGAVLARYFRSGWEFWTAGLSNGLAGFILTWTLFYGLVRA
ncbi:Rab5-interacting protein-domain-containing protein [Cercophora samala]|uniref:ER membrane protein complex subunit 6 n=1 Tax=Cercophora samala TaxID=330535 RepID=A0AA39ZLJ8_9PEZI|nr:Rab5-interacting protein-domain-containing protein [Cercophora samala]